MSLKRHERSSITSMATSDERREKARFEGAFEELIDVTAVTRGRGSHNTGNLNTSRTHVRADGDKRPLHDRAD